MRNNVSVNVLAVEGRYIYIHRKGRRMGQEINLLLISEDGINHYTAIKSLSRLLRSSNTKHKCKQHFCMNCLQGFTQELSRDQHQAYCEDMNCLQGFTQELSRDQHQAYLEDNESVGVEMPKQGSTVEFKDGQNQFKVPFIMYADFKSILEPMSLKAQSAPQTEDPRSLSNPIESPNPNPNQPYTN